MEFVPFSDKGKATKSPRNLKSSSNICKSAQVSSRRREDGWPKDVGCIPSSPLG